MSHHGAAVEEVRRVDHLRVRASQSQSQVQKLSAGQLPAALIFLQISCSVNCQLVMFGKECVPIWSGLEDLTSSMSGPSTGYTTALCLKIMLCSTCLGGCTVAIAPYVVPLPVMVSFLQVFQACVSSLANLGSRHCLAGEGSMLGQFD